MVIDQATESFEHIDFVPESRLMQFCDISLLRTFRDLDGKPIIGDDLSFIVREVLNTVRYMITEFVMS